MDRDELERLKLQAEIDELRVKADTARAAAESERKRRVRNSLVAWVGVLTAAATLGGAALGVYIQGSNFLLERKRTKEVQLTERMVELVGKLGGDNPYARETSALLLASYEGDAIPILLWNLERVQEPAATIEALRLVKGKKSVGEAALLGVLLRAAEDSFAREEGKNAWTEESARALANYAACIGELSTAQPRPALELLDRWQRRLDDQTLAVPLVRRGILKAAVERARSKLAGAAARAT
ncbi:MAG: hypothetical protein A3E31_09515 [Candidatus Rokubacteria bacterium RIFCSPHIGHO2_12_FULL_73_22]|nr:MAG: hypothetical protein A3D33_00800 [Candidatus Rokubacteria bacterium RIFCSPHIGHO2_02_FULL_73_26]OGL01810.1 MAG: hypothetical protein A3E31_09515 [Candidatus Rokubacteria bacterium RIFCSPHIGHO2_12_FULL_73_22]OGL12363.1 MAG: hypothetical protein A3I14_05020 [Candidatus Rokubacteria bacterium RIFCSPLOWO2_02_FULL_73_56]OGL24311.1 MAG: hypothetical protein A3G44_10570 [Candidatus Rokubacteria bacterium RIFCSPLOWO2_12_FULL_73_47]